MNMCPKCNTVVSGKNAQYCLECGAPVETKASSSKLWIIIGVMGSVVLIAGLLLSSFLGGEKTEGPSSKELAKRFAINLPAYWEIDSFRVEASENLGTKVEPFCRSRFKAVVKLKEDTFVEAGYEDNVIFIDPVAKSGEKREIYGVATSKLETGSWKINFQLDNDPLPGMGTPRSFFSGKEVIVKGSEKETKYREKVEKEREAEEEKQRQEREAQRAALISAISSHRDLHGEASSSSEVWPFRLKFNSFDESSGEVVGELEWLTLDAVHRVEGKLSGTTLVFKETEYIKQGNAALNCVYTMSPSGKAMTGTWKGQYGHRGDVHFDLE
jgi:hypothetical protein